MSLETYKDAFCQLRVDRAGNQFSPHKPCMLLAVVELFESGKYPANVIRFDDVLLSRYAEYFEIVKTGKDRLNPWMPFFHLRSADFWQLVPLPGRQPMIEALSKASKKSHIADNIDHVRLENDLVTFLSEASSRHALRETIIRHWFPNHAEQLRGQVEISKCEKALDAGQPMTQKCEVSYRTMAFRRLVREAYEFRCAASGWRIILPDYRVLVEAAHIVPFGETQDDRPQNGIALTPNFHWAMDRNIIAPGPDMQWHVAKTLDVRIADHQPLLELKGKPLLLPRDRKFYPDRDALKWRLDRLE